MRRLADRLITIAKADSLAALRLVARTIRIKSVHKKLFTEIIPNLQDRNSGYTRVIKKLIRRGDGATISVVELLTPRPEKLDEKDEKAAKKKDRKKAAAKA